MLTPADDAKLLELIDRDPGVTLNAIREHGVPSPEEAGRHLKKSGLIARERRRPDVVRMRMSFAIARRFVEPGRFVFLDESGAKPKMMRCTDERR